MVIYRKNYIKKYENIVFEHILILDRSGSYFVMARNSISRKISIFLVVCRKKLIYERSRRGESWQEIVCDNDKAMILEALYNHLSAKTIPIINRFSE